MRYFKADVLARLLAISGRRCTTAWTQLSLGCFLWLFDARGPRGVLPARPAAQAAASAGSQARLFQSAGAGRPSRTGLYDEIVVIDLGGHFWPCLAALQAAVGLDPSLWDFIVLGLWEHFKIFSDLLRPGAPCVSAERAGAFWKGVAAHSRSKGTAHGRRRAA